VVITVWEKIEDHLMFEAGLREKFEDSRGLRDHWENVEASRNFRQQPRNRHRMS